ncbi:anaphase-promoting complex subunit 2 [Dorcoceras hygrometricum]|uniref:Anaphase-promoting complex subunit 2 n=1 Tax=Dorcoceras hygrometricum TaxID=472368 RepID=A0A2Z7C398_9LAMI|nr:anaphase-promoting complex subunit 2 [Dorcoceras hygrometricum]
MRRVAQDMKRRRAKESADGLSPAVARYQQRFALALKIQQMTLCVDNQSQDPVASYSESNRKLCVSSRHGIQSQESRRSGELQSRRKIPVAVFEDSAEAQSSSIYESAAKQLTIYESWMSTAERNSNGKNDKTQSTLKMERING